MSGLNACRYCHGVHTATAQAFGISDGTLAALLTDVSAAPVPERMKPLLRYTARLTLMGATGSHRAGHHPGAGDLAPVAAGG